jgi:predicted GNAT family N-acyltransferase
MFEQQKLVACVSLRPINRSIIKLRQMAVDFSYQGQGIGIYLLQCAEKKAANLGFKEIQLNARYHVQGFYEKCSYQAQGETFLEVTIPHIFMTKKLSN